MLNSDRCALVNRWVKIKGKVNLLKRYLKYRDVIV